MEVRGYGVQSKRFSPVLPHPHTPLLLLPLDLLQSPDDRVHARILVNVVNVHVPDNTFLVDDEDGPFSDTFGP
jgi:hypothetical protein